MYTNALAFLYEYITVMAIDFFDFPVLTGRGVKIAQVPAMVLYEYIAACIGKGFLPNFLVQRKGENFFRLSTLYTITKTDLRAIVYQYHDTPYKRIGEWKKHCNSIARGFEIVCCLAYGGIHKGDNKHSCDMTDKDGKNHEMKIAKGIFMLQAELQEEE